LSAEVIALQARGHRVRVSTVRAKDVAPYRRAVEQSRQRLTRWNPVDPEDLERQLPVQSRDHRTFLIHALKTEGDHDIVGKINVTDVVRGRFESAAMGYDAYDPYAGRGLFAEGLRLVLDLAFAQGTAGGMGLHRVAAAVQPGNVRSAGLLRSLGFQREGFSPGMLWLPGADGKDGWQDHVSYAVRRDEWPAQAYPPPRGRRVVVLVNGVSGSGKTTLARQLATELRIPLFSKDVVKERVADARTLELVTGEGTPGSALGPGASNALWALLADSPVGGVVESCFWPDAERRVVAGLQRCGLDPAKVPEVWCFRAETQATERPLGLGPTVPVDTGQNLGPGDIVRIALQVAWSHGN
jgi:RimJ/RimL family protein N-acetyltransferase/predicted kinase